MRVVVWAAVGSALLATVEQRTLKVSATDNCTTTFLDLPRAIVPNNSLLRYIDEEANHCTLISCNTPRNAVVSLQSRVPEVSHCKQTFQCTGLVTKPERTQVCEVR